MKTIILAGLMVLAATPSYAQTSGTRTPVTHKQVVATNPIGDLLGWYNIEYNRKLTESTTLELSGSTFDLFGDGNRMTRGAIGARYYPQNAALTGFFLGLKGGILQFDDDQDEPFDTVDSSQRFFAVGAEVGYEWLVGKQRNFHVGVGAGGTRLFGGDVEGTAGYPTVRLKIGYAF